MTEPLSSARRATDRFLDRLAGLLLRAIGYGTDDPDAAPLAPSTLTDGQMWAEMAGELRVHSIAREA